MDIILNPSKSFWPSLVKRPQIDRKDLSAQVNSILNEVNTNGDKALKDFTLKFDGIKLDNLKVSELELGNAADLIPSKLKKAIDQAYQNTYKFHNSQALTEPIIETMPGVKCWRKSVAIERIGLYVPGGSAPLFSTVLMLGIPAIIAGCGQIQICTPPNSEGKIDPSILYTANLLGIDKVFKVGGAQAIAAMAFGTESISKVYKIFGPGNQYVTYAKSLVQQAGLAIDMPAGPSEVLVIADQTCNPAFVAADLLSQAEHGPDSQVILLTNNEQIASDVLAQIEIQIEGLPRKDIAFEALKHSKVLVFDDLESCLSFSNEYAPEHLIIASDQANTLVDKVANAGSVFLGNYSCESAGDYASGTNHTLPTNGFAKSHSGVSVDSYVKKITFQEISKSGLESIGETIENMASAESLIAHKNAVSIRLKSQ